MASTQALTPPRLVVTGHAPDGTSVFTSDTQVSPFHPFGPSRTGFSYFHSRLSVPVSNTTMPPDLSGRIPRCPPGGITFGISDFAPNSSAPMHRTQSLDYAVVISGEIVARLDGGEEKIIRAGEFLVQRGVNHEWHNRLDIPCRVMFVMVSAQKIVLENGTELEETVIDIGKK